MIIDGVYYVDNSTLKAVARCDTDAYFTYVAGYRPRMDEKAILKSGSAFHEALATVFRTLARGLSLATAIEQGYTKLAEEYKDWAETEVAYNDRLGWDNIQAVYLAWCEGHLATLPFYFPDERLVEIGFAHPLDDDGEFVFYGRMDGLALHVLSDQVVVVEHKTTGRLNSTWTNQWYMDSQVSGYVWAAQQHDPEVFGCLINGIETSKMPTDSRKCKDHDCPYSVCGQTAAHLKTGLTGPINRTPEQIREWKRTALHLARRYKAMHEQLGADPFALPSVSWLKQQGLFNGSCKWCNLKDFCTVSRPMERFNSMFEYSPWMPYNPLDFLVSGE